MMTLAQPIARCPHCGMRWVVARMPEPDEQGQPYVCVACSWEWEIIAGALVPISRPASTLTDAELRRERHALVTEDTTLRRREQTR